MSMKRIRLDRWATQLQIQQAPRNPRLHLQRRSLSVATPQRRDERRPQCVGEATTQCQLQPREHIRGIASRRKASTASAAAAAPDDDFVAASGGEAIPIDATQVQPVNSPSPKRALRSAKLSALHARLSLPSKLPLQTLARCLIDPTVDSRPGYNNAPLAIIGQDLLGLYTSEYLLCNYPRLPMPVLFAAQYAYVGSATLSSIRGEWGVEAVAEPGEEVDPGLLQLRRRTAGNAMSEDGRTLIKDLPQNMPGLQRLKGSGRRNEEFNYRRGISSRVVYDDEFGDLKSGLPSEGIQSDHNSPLSTSTNQNIQATKTADPSPAVPNPTPTSEPFDPSNTTTLEAASASFIRALVGALYLHTGAASTKAFHTAHILSRHLPLHKLFNFTHPTRDLSRLCAREALEPPVARLISETGRHSRSPVFVVGVFSGRDKLGEGVGSSLDEGRVRASAAALRSWYLYSPSQDEVRVPSDFEGVVGREEKKAWKPQAVDIGEIVT